MINRIYSSVELEENFRLVAKEVYDADLLKADFVNDSEQLVKEINKWIKLETNNKIQNVLNEIDPEAVMILINVVYFKAKWSRPFSLDDVREKEFINLNGERKQVEMMCKLDDYQYGQFEHYRILQLKYHGNCSMYVVLPNENVNLDDLLRELNARKLNEDLLKLETIKVDLQLPKFELKSNINLITILEQLGVTKLFNPEADLSGISNHPMWIGTAIQSAYISVDEKGTEAAVVTAKSFRMTRVVQFRKEEFHVNRPFAFIIRLNGANIFVGAIKEF